MYNSVYVCSQFPRTDISPHIAFLIDSDPTRHQIIVGTQLSGGQIVAPQAPHGLFIV